jgi:hypothetical protein
VSVLYHFPAYRSRISAINSSPFFGAEAGVELLAGEKDVTVSVRAHSTSGSRNTGPPKWDG